MPNNAMRSVALTVAIASSSQSEFSVGRRHVDQLVLRVDARGAKRLNAATSAEASCRASGAPIISHLK
jgi:hypothetical protein